MPLFKNSVNSLFSSFQFESWTFQFVSGPFQNHPKSTLINPHVANETFGLKDMTNTKRQLPSDELTTSEFAKAAGNVSRQTVVRWVQEGIIPDEAVKRTITGRIRIKRWAVSEVYS